MIPKKTKIFLNGKWIGLFDDPQRILLMLKRLRRSGRISSEVSLVRDIGNKEIRILTDEGRIARPLFQVANNKLIINQSHIE